MNFASRVPSSRTQGAGKDAQTGSTRGGLTRDEREDASETLQIDLRGRILLKSKPQSSGRRNVKPRILEHHKGCGTPLYVGARFR